MTALESKPVVVFAYHGHYGHFLRAYASASALSYPVPPRTALLGLIGAVLGLEKDSPQTQLEPAEIAVLGAAPRTHWHRAKLRKDLPPPLEHTLKRGVKGNEGSPERATLIPQEWLLEPHYTIIASLSAAHQDTLIERLEARRWHYPPCLGLSEMSAELELLSATTATAIPESLVPCASLVRRDHAEFSVSDALHGQEPLSVTPLRLPRSVTADRSFTHANYLMERHAKAIPVRTAHAWQLTWQEHTRAIMFL